MSTASHNDSPSGSRTKIVLTRWEERFVAWLIDFVIVSVGLTIMFAWLSDFLSIPFWAYDVTDEMEALFESLQTDPFHYIISALVFLAYWTFLESRSGQSVGKKVMNLKTTTLDGTLADRKSIALSAFGKAFLLPIDVILGRIITSEKRQRIFSRASNTIVIKIKKEVRSVDTNGIKYIKD
jgi:uncharacterized RDD family membrane protein YckC